MRERRRSGSSDDPQERNPLAVLAGAMAGVWFGYWLATALYIFIIVGNLRMIADA